MQFKDHFSTQSEDYAKYRPAYPSRMFEYLGSIAPARQLAWDCATGNGQAAVELANVFDRVIATDASENQIAKAKKHERIDYRVAPGEQSRLESGSVDLVMVAQALHWLNHERFYPELRRVLKKHGIFAASAYNLLRTDPAIERIINRYYYEIVGPYWPPERALIEHFSQIAFPFTEKQTSGFQMEVNWTLDHLIGYLRSWSSTQRFIAATNRNPLNEIIGDLRSAWRDLAQTRRIVWPLTLRIGVNK